MLLKTEPHDFQTFKTTIVRNGSMCYIPVTFDPKKVFGKTRAPVKVTLNGFTYRSTIATLRTMSCGGMTARRGDESD